MLILASLTGLTGYSLPNDALSGTGLRITDSIVLAVPFIGAWASDVLTGGGYPGPLLLQHLYTIHVYFLPVIIALLLAAHLGMVVLQKHTQFVDEPQNVVGRRFWPDYALRTIAALGVTVAVILALAATVEINPIAVYGPYSDWTVTNPAVPDWYAAFLDGALRLGPAWEITIFGHPIPALVWPGMILPAIVFGVLFAWPWIDAAFTRNRDAHDVLIPPTFAPWRVGFGSALIAGGIFLTLAASHDQQALALHQPVQSMVTFYRVLVPAGAVVIGVLAARIARELRSRSAAHGTEAERVITLRRNDSGGFDEEAIGPV
jgi:ubiquinol-cytochrome c reductase cytochrome b subunit